MKIISNSSRQIYVFEGPKIVLLGKIVFMQNDTSARETNPKLILKLVLEMFVFKINFFN